MREAKLSPKALRRLESGSLWFWPTDLQDPAQLPEEASPLLLLEPRGRVAASALYDAASPVPIRVYQRGRREFDLDWARRRWQSALAWRGKVVDQGATNAFRLLHSEGDGTPGLIVDRFAGHLAVHSTARPWSALLPALLAELPPDWEIQSCTLEELGNVQDLLSPAPEDIPYRVNGFQLFARSQGGQKTGAFLDQRENYLALLRWVETLSSREFALDLYSSNGGFARHLAAAVQRVEAVERGQSALDLLEKGLRADQVKNVRAIRADVREYLLGKAQARRDYDVVVVDPPAFAKSKRERVPALQQYADINARALRLVRSGGLFVSCSCSHHISGQDLLDVIREVALQNEKTLQILEKRSQSVDHPILLGVPESEYLKCFYFRVI